MVIVHILAEGRGHYVGFAAVVPIGAQVISLAFEGELALMAERLIKRTSKAAEKAKQLARWKKANGDG